MASNRTIAIAAGLCGGVGLGAWGFYLRALTTQRGEDFMVYDTAVRAWFDGDLHALYDGPALTGLLNAHFADWLAGPLPLHPWLYPPHYLLLLLPLGLLRPAVADALFLGASFIAMVAALLPFFEDRRRRVAGIVMIALCPASAITVLLGQNTFLTCALLAGGFGLIGRQPLLGGALLGVLTYKPQLFLMVPIALIAARQWRALFAATASAAMLAGASAVVFGLAPWRDWIHLMTAPSALFAEWSALARLNGQSIYTYAVLLGAGPALADALQGAAALIAAAFVYAAYRSALAAELKLAVLLAATMLAAPHVIDYDALTLGIAATVMLLRTSEEALHPAETLLLVLVWASPFYNPPSVWPLAYATPLLVTAFILRTMRREALLTPRAYGYSRATGG